MKRTYNDALSDVTDAPDLQHLVQDKRSLKRATSAKGRRRNRRYENRVLSAQSLEGCDDGDRGEGDDRDESDDDAEDEYCDDGLRDGLEADS